MRAMADGIGLCNSPLVATRTATTLFCAIAREVLNAFNFFAYGAIMRYNKPIPSSE